MGLIDGMRQLKTETDQATAALSRMSAARAREMEDAVRRQQASGLVDALTTALVPKLKGQV